MTSCPECGSTRFFRSGFRDGADGEPIQRFLCRKCGYRFSEPGNNPQIVCRTNRNHQICTIQKVKNLVSTTETKTVGDLQQSQNTAKIIEYLVHLERKGKSQITLENYSRRLKQLARKGLNLLEPEEIEGFLSRQKHWSNTTKAIDVSVYSGFLKFHKIPWDPPEYKPEKKAYILPYQEDLEQLISGAGRRLSPFLLVLKETAARKGEAVQMKWNDVDMQRKLVSITPEKGGNPRTLRISDRLTEVLRCLNRETERVFNATLSSISSNYYQQRKKIARKTGNPRLLKIGLHDFRHWKLTQIAKEFNGNAHYVQYFAGHRDLNTQQVYVHLAEQYYGKNASSEFVVEVAKNVGEASKLLAVGFEFVHEYQGVMIYRKRK